MLDIIEVQQADFGLTLALWVAFFALSQLLMPEPDIEEAKAKTLDDFNFPTATEGRIIPLHWGTDLIKGPNVIWYGDLRDIPIVEEVRINLFKKKEYTTGHEYHVGFQMGICQGPAILKKIRVGDEVVWSGTQSTQGDIEIDIENLKGTFEFFPGTTTQSRSTYLQTHQSPCPAYRGMCYGVWKGGYVGKSTTIKPWSFEVERIPTDLGVTDSKVNSADCGLLHAAYEIFRNTSWGYGYPATDFNVTNWQTAAATLAAEGNGMSMIMSSQKDADVILKEIQRQMDGRFHINPQTGKWEVVLIRDGYSTVGLKKATVANVLAMTEYSRSSWEGTINNIRIKYKRRANSYTDGYAPATDAASMQIQGRKVSATYTYPGVRDDTLANKLAWREIRVKSYPFAKVRMEVNREFWDSYVGEVILLTWDFDDFCCDDLPFRITRIDFGNPGEPKILIDAVQDVFSWRAASFADQPPTGWVLPPTSLIAFPAADQLVYEAPYAVGRRDDTYDEGRLWLAGESQGRGEYGFEARQRNASGTPTGDYYHCAEVGGFTWKGTLAVAVDPDATTIDVTTDMNITKILETTAADCGEYLYNMFMIGNELICCTGVTAITGGLRLTGCLRGFCDTAQAAHSLSDTVWFVHTGGGLSDTAFDPSYNVDIKLLPYDNVGNKLAESDGGITVAQVAMDYRDRRPYPPTFIKWNAVQYPTTVDITGDVAVTYNRRDYRILNENSQHSTDASTINGDFPSNNDTRYRLKLYDGASLQYTSPWNASGAASYTMTFEKILRYLDGLPTSLKMSVDTRHTFSSTDYTARYEVTHEATVQASAYDDDVWLGVCQPSTTSPNSWTAPATGTYAFTLGTSIVGDVEARINSGSWQQVVVSGNTTGNLTGVTAADTIEVRHLDSTSSDEVLLTIAAPSGTENGFGILVFA
jgi:hypothetical protein